MRIAIIGGIGSGKSEVLAVAKELGFTVLSADKINSELLLDSEYVKKIDAAFPGVVENGEVDRAKLSAIVFSDGDKRALLNSIAHPEIMKRIDACDADPLVVELPLAIESGALDCFDEIILVTAKKRVRLSRLKTRGLNCRRARAVMRAQVPVWELKRVATSTIENDGELSQLRDSAKQVLRIFCE